MLQTILDNRMGCEKSEQLEHNVNQVFAHQLTGHTVRTPANAGLIFSTSKQAMDRLPIGFQLFHQGRELFVALDVMFVDHFDGLARANVELFGLESEGECLMGFGELQPNAITKAIMNWW